MYVCMYVGPNPANLASALEVSVSFAKIVLRS